MNYSELEQQNKVLRMFALMFAVALIFSLIFLSVSPYYVCKKSGGVLYQSGRCINLTALPYCRDSENRLYEDRGFFWLNGS